MVSILKLAISQRILVIYFLYIAEGQYLALRLHISLAASQYATMVLREVMKQRTSAAYHSNLKRARAEDDGTGQEA